MIEEFKGFKSSDGQIHTVEYEAWKAEFSIWLKKHGVDNAGIVAQIVKAVDDGKPDTLNTLRQIIDGMAAASAPKIIAATIEVAIPTAELK